MKILVADKFPETGLDALRALGNEVTCDPGLKEGALVEALTEIQPEALIVRSTKVQAEHLDAAPGLTLIIRAGAGVNTIDVAGASARGVFVANCPGKNSIAVAELAFAHLLSIDRHVVNGATDLRAGNWNKKRYSKAEGIYGRTLGLLGLGQIGREMIPRAHAFGLRVVAWSRSLTDEMAAELGVERAANPVECARESDILSVHVALNDQTRGLVGSEVLEALGSGGVVINTSRGGVVDESALRSALADGRVRAGLDVFENEPSSGTADLEPGLFALDGIQGSHHVGASTEQAQVAVADEAVRIVRTFLEEGTVPNCVNLSERTPATHLLSVRHRDQVGVLAGVLNALRKADVNVQEMENVVFLGAEAACARIQLDCDPGSATMEAIRESSEHIIALNMTVL